VEAEAGARGLRRLFVEASEPARRMFERKGFTVLDRRELVRDGVALHNFAMEKGLPAD
jgi:putative acetyltransferase